MELNVRKKVKILECIDYTLSRKGYRSYWIANEDGYTLERTGCWRTKSACQRRINELKMEYTGTVTENRNYSHWADFVPVKEGRMIDDEQ